MLKRCFLLAVFCVASAMCSLSSASAAYLGLVGSADFVKPRNDFGGSNDAKWGFGGGALIGLPILPIEVGALYVQRKYETTAAATTTEFTRRMLEIPALIRIGTGPISIGVGGYYAKAIGSQRSDSGGVTRDESYGTLNQKNYDAGALGSVAVNIPLGVFTSFLVDGRYHYGLVNNSKSDPALKFSGFQILAGIKTSL